MSTGGSISPPLRRRLWSSALLRQNALLFVANMATSAFSYLYHPIVGHFLGKAGYGTLVSLGAFTIVLLIPTQVVANIANKFAADLSAQGRMDQVSYLVKRATAITLALGALSTAVFVALSPTLARFLNTSPQFMVIISLGYIFSFAYPLNSGIVQGRQQFAWFGAFNILTTFLKVAGTGLILYFGGGIGGALWVALGATFVLYALSFLPLRDVLRAPAARIPSLRPFVLYALGATLVVSGNLLLVNLDTVLAKHFLSADDAGYYDALATMGRIVLFVGGSFVWVMFPKVAALSRQGRSHGAVLGWTMAGVFALSAPVVVVFKLFPSQIITVIFHAPTAVSQQLVWYGLAMLMLALSNVFINYFLSLARLAFVPFLLLCCVLEVVLISAWHGSVGQVVAAMLVVMAFLLCGLAALYGLQAWRDARGARVRQPAYDA